MITPHQIRAARALLGLSRDQAESLTGITRERLLQAEDDKAESDFNTVEMLESAYEKQGIMFIESGEGGFGPGVRLKHQIGEPDGIRPENLNSANDG